MKQVKDITDAQVKEACQIFWNGDTQPTQFVDEILADITDVSRKVANRKLEQCAERNLIGFAVSLRSCWWTGD